VCEIIFYAIALMRYWSGLHPEETQRMIDVGVNLMMKTAMHLVKRTTTPTSMRIWDMAEDEEGVTTRKMIYGNTRRKKLLQFTKRHYKLLQNKGWVSFSLIGRMTNLMQLSITLNTQDVSAALVLRCCENMVFQKTLPAIRNVIGT
jgi:hypothetical protein